MRKAIARGRRREVDLKAAEILRRAGFRADMNGYYYLRDAVCCGAINPDYLNRLVTKCIYDEVADMYRANTGQVERNIRTAITSAYKEDPFLFTAVLGVAVARKHSNARVIATIVDLIQMDFDNDG